MKINWHLVNYDMLGNINLPACPSPFRTQAENIVMLVARLEPFSYSKISQFDKHLIFEYWRQYDGLDRILAEPATFKNWFFNSATNPEFIRRARQWLVEHNYFMPSQGVADMAQEAAKGVRASVKGH